MLLSRWRFQSIGRQLAGAGIWADGQLCGMIHLLHLDGTNHWASLSYWLDEAHQGQGIMTASCRAFIAHGFNEWKLNRVTIECATNNARSRKIPERLGFKLEGITREIEWLHDHYADHAVYGLLRFDFVGGMESPLPSKQPDQDRFQLNNTASDFLQSAFDLFNRRRFTEAEAACRKLVQTGPPEAQLFFLLGMALHQTGRDEEAVKWLAQAAQMEPSSGRFFHGLGCACQTLKNYRQAAEAFERALSLNPQSNPVCYNFGNTCHHLGNVERAVELFQKAVKIEPDDFASWNNLGKSLHESHRLDEAIAAYDRALQVKPDYALAHYGRAITLLTAGRFAEGFREYEWREHFRNPRRFDRPLWKGERISKTLFIHAEQGFGDTIQMVRFLPEIRERAGAVILECRPELKTLFQHSQCADTVIAFGEAIPPFDYFLPMSSLPYALGISSSEQLPPTPYLRAAANDVQVSDPAGRLKAGLAWAGNPGHHQDAARSLRLELLAPLLNVPGVVFYSLQQTVPEPDAAFLRSVSDIVQTPRAFDDFLATAAFINTLDLVITVDTAAAHLAGALGKPVWLLLQFSPDWRWGLSRLDSPWYSTMRLFRQTERGQWPSPIRQVVEALQSLRASCG
jgi:tetratricopeptide (TPR) repeat protein